MKSKLIITLLFSITLISVSIIFSCKPGSTCAEQGNCYNDSDGNGTQCDYSGCEANRKKNNGGGSCDCL